MKIPPPKAPTPSLWPNDKTGIMAIAQQWYEPRLVSVNEDALSRLELPPISVGAEASMNAGSLGLSWADSVPLSIALNSINYQFWDHREGEFLRYDFEGAVGALGMRNAFERAWHSPTSPLSLARQGQPMNVTDIQDMFGDIPEPQSRADILNEILASGRLEEASARLVSQANEVGGFTPEQANTLATFFPLAFGDAVLKKAQLAISEVWVKAHENGAGLSCSLTAFADYQIPNILRTLGILDYSPELTHLIDARVLIPYGSPEECAIRGASLIAVEKISEKLGVPVAAVDHYLWTRRKEAQTPFHLTVTTAY